MVGACDRVGARAGGVTPRTSIRPIDTRTTGSGAGLEAGTDTDGTPKDAIARGAAARAPSN